MMLSKKEYEEYIEKTPKPFFVKRLTYEEYVEKYKNDEEKIKKLFKKNN